MYSREVTKNNLGSMCTHTLNLLLKDIGEMSFLQKILQKFTEQFLAAETEYAKQVPGLSIIATINTTCYSNQADFPEDSEFVKILTKDTTLQIPQQDPERRQFLNQRLSEFRAETITAYLRQLLSEHDRKDRTLRIRYRPEGKGEDRSEEQIALERDSSDEKYLKPQTDSISAELKIKERGPRVSHPSDIILYEVIEE